MNPGRILGLLFLMAGLGLLPGLARAEQPGRAEMDFFEKEIRPLLAARCYKCHGNIKEVKGGLKLTSRDAVLKGGESGPAVIAGNPGESPLIKAVKYDELQMPPDGKLSDAEIASLTKWIELGLPWPQAPEPPATAEPAQPDPPDKHSDFWSFQPVKDYPLPDVTDRQWPATSVDRFVLAALEKKGLKPSPRADKRTLIRRATFDLTGLPPTPEEIDAFGADESPEAMTHLVDRLLASPHYGERWGRYWLDVARYADNKGYVFFQEPDYPWSYTYRDYVVQALNEDKPYDQFIVEQLAADRLPLGADKRALTAMGFLTVGNVFMNNQYDVIDDRIDVVSRGLLGLTVSCARCHDHKFDPIPTKDYYSLYGVFASSRKPDVLPLFAEPPATDAYKSFAENLKVREDALNQFMLAKSEELRKSARERAAEYLMAAHALRDKPNIEEFMLISDTKDLNPTMIVRWKSYLDRRSKASDPVFVVWHALSAIADKDFEAQAAGVLARALESQKPQGLNALVAQAFVGKSPKTLSEVAEQYNQLLLAADKLWQEKLDQAAKAKQPAPTSLEDPAQEELRRVFYEGGAPANFAMSDLNELELLPDRAAQEERRRLFGAVEQWLSSGPGGPPRAMVLVDAEKLYEPRVFLRGNPNNPGSSVPRQFLKVLAGENRKPFQEGSGRLELARAIADPANPLTARVMVNRIWLHHFGRGLVSTPSDFGTRSDAPTHPELLDHLASEFVRGGWSIKKMHRTIMLSAAYQQASDDRPECLALDPENKLLWKMNRGRLDFEAMRDALLAVSGRLDPAIGGPPVKQIMDPAATRRTLYGFIDRLNLPVLFRSFDFPSPDSTNSQRDTTMVPQQALFLMNNRMMVAAARDLLARPELAHEQEFQPLVRKIIRLVYGREATGEEVRMAREFLGETATPSRWEQYAQALLLANEFVFVD